MTVPRLPTVKVTFYQPREDLQSPTYSLLNMNSKVAWVG